MSSRRSGSPKHCIYLLICTHLSKFWTYCNTKVKKFGKLCSSCWSKMNSMALILSQARQPSQGPILWHNIETIKYLNEVGPLGVQQTPLVKHSRSATSQSGMNFPDFPWSSVNSLHNSSESGQHTPRPCLSHVAATFIVSLGMWRYEKSSKKERQRKKECKGAKEDCATTSCNVQQWPPEPNQEPRSADIFAMRSCSTRVATTRNIEAQSYATRPPLCRASKWSSW